MSRYISATEEQASGDAPPMAASKPRPVSMTGVISVAVFLAVIGGGAALLAFKPWKGADGLDMSMATFAVRRDELVMTVKEVGSVEAQNRLELRSEVEGQTTIISIVPEGTLITGECVANGRVLIEFDSARLRERLVSEEEALETAQINFNDAEQSKIVQINENQNNINNAHLRVRFARMDLEKYLGDKLANALLEENREEIERADSDFITRIDLTDFAESDDLGGEALQRRRSLMNDIRFAEEEFSRAQEDFINTEELQRQNFVTRMALDEARLKRDRLQARVDQANTDYQLFLRYDFARISTDRLSNYITALQNLERVQGQAESELSKALVRLRGRERHLRIQEERAAKTVDQIENCIIRATRPGMVVYENARGRPPIEEGAQVRERQTIAFIPDNNSMAVEVDIHESVVQRVHAGMPALVRMEALNDVVFQGRVERVSILPDSTNWVRRQTGVKVYKTIVTIDGVDGRLRPGMTGSVEIFTGRLSNVLLVPVQAVHSAGSRYFVCIIESPGYRLQEVEIGAASDKFAEVRTGLVEGDIVRLDPPSDLRQRLEPFMPRDDRQNNGMPIDFDMPEPILHEGRDGGAGSEAIQPGQRLPGAPEGGQPHRRPDGQTRVRPNPESN